MERIKTLSGYSPDALDSIYFYGVGAFILYCVAPLMLVLYQISHAKKTQGVTSMAPYIARAGGYTFAWLIFITLFFIVAVITLPPGNGNPAIGIFGFWHIDWLDSGLLDSIGTASTGSSTFSDEQLEAAKIGAVFMLGVKIVYFILLIVFFWLIFSFVYSLTTLKTKQAGEDFGIGYAANIAFSFVTAAIVFSLIMQTESSLLEHILNIAIDKNKLSGVGVSTETDITGDLVEIVRIGLKAMNPSTDP